MSTLDAVVDQLKQNRDTEIDGTEAQGKISSMQVEVMEEVAMRAGRSENTLMTIFSDVRKMRNAITRPKRNPDELEEARENSAFQNDLLETMQAIRDNINGNNNNNNNNDDDKDSGGGGLGKLRLAASVAAVALGSIGGAIAGLTSPLRMLMAGIGRFIKALTPKAIKNFAVDIVKGTKDAFTAFYRTIKSTFGMVGNTIKALIMDGKIGAAITRVKDSFKALSEPFKVLRQTLSGPSKLGGLMGKVSGAFKGLGSFLKTFASAVGAVAKIVGKLFAPIASLVIIGKNIFEDFKSGTLGFGTLKDIIDDLFKFFVTDLLDLVKGGVAWIAEKLGFENFAAILNSFSFSEMYQNISDKAAEAIAGAVDWVGGLFTSISEGMVTLKDSLMENVSGAVDSVKDLLGEKVFGVLSKIFNGLFFPYIKLFNVAKDKAKEIFNFSNIWDMLTGKKDLSFSEIFNAAGVEDSSDMTSSAPETKKTSASSIKEVTEKRETSTSGGVVISDTSQRVVQNTTNGHTSVSMQWSEMDGQDPTLSLRA